jgi:hypothetical protein
MVDHNDGWQTKPVKKKKTPNEGGPSFFDMLKFVKSRVPEGTYLTHNGETYRCVNGQIEFMIFRHSEEVWVSNITRSFHRLSIPERARENDFEIIRKLITGTLKFAEPKPIFKPKKKSEIPVENPSPVFAVGEPTWNIDKNLPVYKRVIPPPPPPVKMAETLESAGIEISNKIKKCLATLWRKNIGKRTRDEYEIKLSMYRRWEQENQMKIRTFRKMEESVFLGDVVASFQMLCESFHWDLSEETLADTDFVGEANYSLCTIEIYLEEISSGKKFDTGGCTKEEYRVVQNLRELKKITVDFKTKYGF